MTKVLKGSKFTWTSQAQRSFEDLKEKLTHTPILALPCFEKVFELLCLQSGHMSDFDTRKKTPYFSEKLSGSRRGYSTYDKEFTAII